MLRKLRRGLTEADAVKIARRLKAATCDAVEVSCGYGDFMHTIRMPKPPRGSHPWTHAAVSQYAGLSKMAFQADGALPVKGPETPVQL